MGEMKPAILAICIVVFAAGCILGIYLYRLRKKIRELRTERDGLVKEKAKISDQVRRKGITVNRWKKEVGRLKKELDKYKDGPLKVELTLPERRIILDALEAPGYKEKVQAPATKRFIRIIFNTLRRKIKESIKEV